jgi:hypothetical protein
MECRGRWGVGKEKESIFQCQLKDDLGLIAIFDKRQQTRNGSVFSREDWHALETLTIFKMLESGISLLNFDTALTDENNQTK